MRYLVIFFALFFISLNTNATANGSEHDITSYLCSDNTQCPEYVYRPCGLNSCTQADCRQNETPFFNHCISIDCSLTKVPSEQDGLVCVKKHQCELQTDEYRASNGSCIPCPSPGVFDNDTCNVCPSGSVYSVQDGTCVTNTCSDGYELPTPNSTMCYKKCDVGYEMDVFGNCNKKLECIPPAYEYSGKCVTDNQPEQPEVKECQTIVSSINCLSNAVFNRFSDATLKLGSLLIDISDALGIANDTLQTKIDEQGQNNNNNGNGENNQDADTSSMQAETPFHEITQQNLDPNIFSSNSQCPSDKSFEKWGMTYTFSYSKICDVLDYLSYLVMAIAYLYAAFLLTRK